MEGAGENVDDFKGINGVSKRFMREKEEDGEIELSLGLSMNGRFGIDPTSKKLKRSSTDPQAREVAPLVRACSVPPLECKENGNCSEDVGLHAASSGVSHLQELLLNEAPTMASTSRRFPPELVAAADPDLDPVMTDEDSLRNTLTDMPYVFTGANDDRIEGFLYRFKMEEDLKIVCVCHGLFLSPAEFVKHGGGGDVAYPLKHIVVNPSPLY